MKNKGWIYLHRSIIDSKLWKSEKFTRSQAWIDLLLLANYKDGVIIVRDHIIKVNRGQVGWSQQKLAKKWKWSRTKTNNFLKYLEREHQVVVDRSKSSSIITIINYDKYQNKEHEEDMRKTSEKHEKDTNNKVIIKENKYISKDIGKPVQGKLELSLKKKTEHGNSEINECTEYLKNKLGASLDGSVKENRQYCYNLLRKMKKDYPDSSPVENVKILIEAAIKDKFHCKNATSFKYLYYNTQKISVSFRRNKFNNVAVIS